MASETKLVLVFEDSEEKKVRHSFNYVKDDLTAAAAKALMNGMITNGSVYVKVPETIVSASLVTTTETALDVSD